MKKKIIVGTIVIGLVLATIGVYFIRNITEKTVPQEENNNQSIKVVNVDRIISAPDHYKGF